ncbi:nicotinate-nucleotide--dimethylbenzimidazole phosphoribosyltransferase [Marinobacter salicampi]|uniref:nicotinate-nucleotide--dimethylbenzimidazole phosphoribosyltransferase n=1 Tax=Marinobacter salicampi TaxID=435907 RepID=UPI00140AAC8E|nr:nicotinate-nucleotide--dimethylbenzimidazole phosphoribosyltransferase [Marinobacter salicampi]
MPLPLAWQSAIATPEAHYADAARRRQDSLTKPPGSLGLLETAAIELCAQQGTHRPGADRVQIAIFAADHGVCAEGISAFPQAVTAQMIANFAHGGAAISVLARMLGAGLDVINLGTVTPLSTLPGVRDETIAPGTANLATGPAMTRDQLEAAIDAGDRAAHRAAAEGAQLFIGGDMGIGNTTSAAAVACALLGAEPEQLAGPGTGLDPAGVVHKAAVIKRALKRHGKDQAPLAVLASLGGFELAALAGAFLGCAARRIPVLVDGFIVTVAALAAVREVPELQQWLHFAHRSSEPGHGRVLDALEARPLLDMGMRLGEGSGAAVAVPLVRSACALHNEMARFADAGVSDGQ